MSKVLTTKSNRIVLGDDAIIDIQGAFLIVKSDWRVGGYRKQVIWPMTEILNYREEEE